MLNLDLPFPSGRQPVLGRSVVATSQPLATQAGAKALARGGNAVDAALAAAITLTVVEPVMNGIGGDCFAIVWDGGRLHGLNSSGRSPAIWSPGRFRHLGSVPLRGWESVTVPGQVAGWVALSERFGRLPFDSLFEDAIRHARDGFPVSPVISRLWALAVNDLRDHPGFSAFMPNGRAPNAGEIWRFKEQAHTLEDIADTRGASFYKGRLAEAIVRFAGEHGAGLSLEDMASHVSRWVEPIHTKFRGHEIHEIPPNGQGLAALIALGVLERLPIEDAPAGSVERMHLEIEAMRLAFADLHAFVGDPASMTLQAGDLLSDAYLSQRARAIDPRRAGEYGPGRPESGGTVYLCTADASGGMVSYIQSNYRGFGSGVVVPGTGIALHNRGSAFVTTPGHANEVDGGKLPLHSIIPAFITKAGRPVMALGVMGGNMQPQGHLQVAMRTLVEGLNPQASSDAPRWRITDAGTLTLEAAVPEKIARALEVMGHRPQVAPRESLDFGSAQLAQRLALEDGTHAYIAGSDHRRDGQATAC